MQTLASQPLSTRASMFVKSATLSLYINTDIISLLAKDDMRDSKTAQNRKQMFGNKTRVMQGMRAYFCQVGAS